MTQAKRGGKSLQRVGTASAKACPLSERGAVWKFPAAYMSSLISRLGQAQLLWCLKQEKAEY